MQDLQENEILNVNNPVKVMIVEDDEIIRRGIHSIINRVKGFSILSECEDGHYGWECYQRKCPDLLITDIRMHRMDGLQLIEQVRAVDKDIYILILSGYSEFVYAQKALQLKVYDYILKPINVGKFVDTLLDIQKQLRKTDAVVREPDQNEKSRLIIRKIKKYVSENLTGDISLSTIAAKSYLTPNYLSTLFKSETGINYTDYVVKERIDHAKKLLRDTQLKNYEIAEICGYSNAKHFAMSFKRHTGLTPLQYKNSSEDEG